MCDIVMSSYHICIYFIIACDSIIHCILVFEDRNETPMSAFNKLKELVVLGGSAPPTFDV